jgi:hypothetical protein
MKNRVAALCPGCIFRQKGLSCSAHQPGAFGDGSQRRCWDPCPVGDLGLVFFGHLYESSRRIRILDPRSQASVTHGISQKVVIAVLVSGGLRQPAGVAAPSPHLKARASKLRALRRPSGSPALLSGASAPPPHSAQWSEPRTPGAGPGSALTWCRDRS